MDWNWFAIVVYVSIAVGVSSWFITWKVMRHYLKKAEDDAYMNGVQIGQSMETAWVRRDAVERERMRVARILHDGGRVHHARPNIGPAKIHKPQIGTPSPRKRTNPL